MVGPRRRFAESILDVPYRFCCLHISYPPFSNLLSLLYLHSGQKKSGDGRDERKTQFSQRACFCYPRRVAKVVLIAMIVDRWVLKNFFSVRLTKRCSQRKSVPGCSAKICAVYFCLVYDVERRTIKMHTVIIETYCTFICFATGVSTDRDGHLDVHKRVMTGNRRMALHRFHMENENEFNSSMASDIQDWNPDGRLHPFMSTCMD